MATVALAVITTSFKGWELDAYQHWSGVEPHYLGTTAKVNARMGLPIPAKYEDMSKTSRMMQLRARFATGELLAFSADDPVIEELLETREGAVAYIEAAVSNMGLEEFVEAYRARLKSVPNGG